MHLVDFLIDFGSSRFSCQIEKMNWEFMLPNSIFAYSFMCDDAEITTSKLYGSHVLETTHARHKKGRPCKEYRCGAGQIPSEGQVRTSHNSRVPELG